jgi:hypothetical protein
MIYHSARLSDAVITLESGSESRSLLSFIGRLVIGVLDLSWESSPPRFKIVVRTLDSDEVEWSNDGYTPDVDPEGCFEEIRDEVEYFGLDEFLRRHTPGYFRT